jgi:hypothetical protein
VRAAENIEGALRQHAKGAIAVACGNPQALRWPSG